MRRHEGALPLYSLAALRSAMGPWSAKEYHVDLRARGPDSARGTASSAHRPSRASAARDLAELRETSPGPSVAPAPGAGAAPLSSRRRQAASERPKSRKIPAVRGGSEVADGAFTVSQGPLVKDCSTGSAETRAAARRCPHESLRSSDQRKGRPWTYSRPRGLFVSAAIRALRGSPPHPRCGRSCARPRPCR